MSRMLYYHRSTAAESCVAATAVHILKHAAQAHTPKMQEVERTTIQSSLSRTRPFAPHMMQRTPPYEGVGRAPTAHRCRSTRSAHWTITHLARYRGVFLLIALSWRESKAVHRIMRAVTQRRVLPWRVQASRRLNMNLPRSAPLNSLCTLYS